MTTDRQQAAAASEFSQRWSGKGYEKGDTQKFWLELLQKVYGVDDPYSFVEFEDKVMVDSTNFMDVYLPSTRVLIEQKSIDKNLGAPIHQSDGAMLNPFQQAKKYIVGLPLSRHPRWVVTCNFREFWVYDMEQPNGEPQKIQLANLAKEYYRLQFLVDTKSEHITKEMQVSMQAGEIVGRIYEALLKQYRSTGGSPVAGSTGGSPVKSQASGLCSDPEILRWLNILCVRIVFCLYAEDAGVFAHDQFHNYLATYEAKDLRSALIRLFETLNTPQEKRSKYLQDDLKAFPYTNGGLFAEEIEIPQFTDELKRTLLDNASLDFDWSEISPTIFGAVFESTLNPMTRRSGGMHYTSIENIHKVIDPLFLNDLRHELDEILEVKVEKERRKRLDAYQDKLSQLTFLDPACGSGNFLTETYLSLRRLENEVINARHHGQSFLGIEEANPIKVSINQFYGIEINDFAVTVATTALWISEAQMLRETERLIHRDIDFLPLKSYSNIREGNALRMEWDTLTPSTQDNFLVTDILNVYKTDDFDSVPMVSEQSSPYGTVHKELNVIAHRVEQKDINELLHQDVSPVTYNYIMGNPPFVGARWMSKEQKQDVINVFGNKWAGVGDLDYVACWFKKASSLISGTNTHVALVSTNSITQGGAVANLWKPLFAQGVHIDFAWRTFRWDSEASQKAHVHCVIIGFSKCPTTNQKALYINNQQIIPVDNINGYLLDAPDIFIEKRMRPLCDVPQIVLGGQPIDDGNFLLTEEEKDELLCQEPQATPFIRSFMMGKDFIERRPRYCLWLQGADPSLLRRCPSVMRRVEKVRVFRLKSNRASTLKAAETPTLFGTPFECESDYIALPKVSSENRKYIPIDYLSKDIIPGDKLFCLQNASLFHFGILTSNVHMAWVRATCGRLKSDYSYSNTIVYNNFPWPTPSDAQKARIEQTAQAILDARALYPDNSLADLYDELTMPVELCRAHQENDRAVMQAYGFPVKSSFVESNCVAELFTLYKELTNEKNNTIHS